MIDRLIGPLRRHITRPVVFFPLVAGLAVLSVYGVIEIGLATTGRWERDLMQRYGATRPVVQRVLTKLAEVAAVQRKPGHGWRFLPTISDPTARAESYRLRQIIEPAALLEPGYRLAPGWIDDIQRDDLHGERVGTGSHRGEL